MNGVRVLLIGVVCFFKLIVLAAAPVASFEKSGNAETVSCSLPAPSNFSAVAVSPSAVNLSWTAVTNAAFYRLRGYQSGVTAPVVDELLPSTQTAYTANNLQGGGTNYSFYLSSVCPDSGEEGPTTTTLATTIIISEVVLQAYEPVGNRTYHNTPYPFNWNSSTYFWGEISLVTDPNRKVTFSLDIGTSFYSGQSGLVAHVAPLWSTLGNTSLVNENGNPAAPVQKYVSLLLDNVEVYRFEIVKSGSTGTIQRVSLVGSNNYSFKVFTALSRNPAFGGGGTDRSDNSESAAAVAQPTPNPFSDYLNLPADADSNQPFQASLYNLNGQLVAQNTFDSNQPFYRFSTSDVPPGVYLLRCAQGANVRTFKVLKLN